MKRLIGFMLAMQQQLLCRLLLLLACSSSARAQPTAANVSNSNQLLFALQSNAEVIVLQNDVAMGEEFVQFEGAPLQIQRNVTVTGTAASRASIDTMPVLDLQNKVGVLQLCSSCTFMLMYVSIANENRAGTGGGISVFKGQPGSRVEWLEGIGLRPACPPTSSALALLNNTQRSALFPSPPGGGQLVRSTNLTYRGRLYPDMLMVMDLSTDVVPQQLTNSSFTGGYAIRRRNATRACDVIVSNECLQRRLPEDCIAELLGSGAIGNNTGSGLYASRSNVVALAVPVALGGALILAALAALLLWRRRRARTRRQSALKPLGPAEVLGSVGTDVETLTDQDAHGAPKGASSASQQPGSRSTLMQQPAASGEGPWQLLWSSGAGGTARDDDIELGVLLGAGSFARVFKGKWSGLDVAVKVIHHDRESAKSVATEVQLMMSLNHPNIVRAYHCITRQMAPNQAASSTLAAQPREGSLQPSAARPGVQAAAAAASAGRTAARAAVPSDGAGSGSWPFSPGLQAPTVGSMSTATSLRQQRQTTDPVPLQDQGGAMASFVPYVGFSSMALPGSNLDIASSTAAAAYAAAAVKQEGPGTAASSAVSVATLSPVTPPATGGVVAPASTVGSTSIPTGTSGSTQLGVVSSSGLSYFVQDLDAAVLPVYQRREQLSPLPSMAGSSSADTFSGVSNAAVHATPAHSGRSGPEIAATSSHGHGQLGSFDSAGGAGLLSIRAGGSSGSRMALPGVAPSSGVLEGLQQQQQQQQQQMLALPSSGPSIGGSSVVGSSSAASGSNASRPWHVVFSSNSEVQPASQGGVTGVRGVGEVESSRADTSGGGRDRRDRPQAAMCETWLVTELCDRGTLARQASDWQPQHNEQDMQRLLHLLQDVARGLKLLKSQCIVHADLNAHNVLVASSSVARYGMVAKVADLGLSRVLKQYATHRTTGTVGMLTHQPPELLQDGRMSPAVDIYSFGIMMYEVFTGQAAFGRMRYGQIYHQVVVIGARPVVPPDMPEDYELLMKRCWASEASDRPSVDMLLDCLDLMIEDRQQLQE